MNTQELFDKIAVHLLTQNAKAMNANGCKYRLERDEKVLKCAVGCLIDDSKYDPAIESKTITQLLQVEHYELLADLVFGENKKLYKENHTLLRQLQNVHDDSLPTEWYWQLVKLAEMYELNTDAISSWAPNE